MTSQERKVIYGFLAIALFQVSWHSLFLMHNDFSQCVLRLYLYRDSQSGKGVSGYLDLVLPTLLLGLLTGWEGWQWTSRRLHLFVVLIAIGIVALGPICLVFLSKELIWWWPKTISDLIVGLVVQVIKGILMVGFFAYITREWRSSLHKE